MNLPLVKNLIGVLNALPVDEKDEVIRRLGEEDDLELREGWKKLGTALKEKDAKRPKTDEHKS